MIIHEIQIIKVFEPERAPAVIGLSSLLLICMSWRSSFTLQDNGFVSHELERVITRGSG